MKNRSIDPEPTAVSPEDSLCNALLALDTRGEMRAFLRDLCTPAELEALIDRWRVVPYLLKGVAYREIHDRTAVSVTTIGRVARFLNSGNGGYQAAVGHEALRGSSSRRVPGRALRGTTTAAAPRKRPRP
jgi:TrpR-related protein YerC/YecD